MKAIYPKIKQMSPQLIVADLERSLDFYIQVLRFEIDFRYEDFYAAIISGHYSIHLKLGKPDPEERTAKRKEEHLDLNFAVENIEEFFEAIKRQPVNIVQSLRNMPYGTEFYIADPDGYLLGFVE